MVLSASGPIRIAGGGGGGGGGVVSSPDPTLHVLGSGISSR